MYIHLYISNIYILFSIGYLFLDIHINIYVCV